jgi:hypothetical protein
LEFALLPVNYIAIPRRKKGILLPQRIFSSAAATAPRLSLSFRYLFRLFRQIRSSSQRG